MDNQIDGKQRLLAIFSRMLAVAEEERHWFEQNRPGEKAPVDRLLGLIDQRQQLMAAVDTLLQELGGREQVHNLFTGEPLRDIISRIEGIDRQLQEQAAAWQHSLQDKIKDCEEKIEQYEDKLKLGSKMRQANRVYNNYGVPQDPLFFDGKR